MDELQLWTVVHPILVPNPWNAPEGWRWAIHTDNRFNQVDVGCLMAGWEPTKDEAELILSRMLIMGRRAVTAVGGCSAVHAVVLHDSPLNDSIVAELQVLA